MIYAIAILFVFQLISEVAVQRLGLPLPGPLVDMLVLLVALLLYGRVPDAISRHAAAAHDAPVHSGGHRRNDAFRPGGVRMAPFLASCVGGAAVTLVVMALTLRWMLTLQKKQTP